MMRGEIAVSMLRNLRRLVPGILALVVCGCGAKMGDVQGKVLLDAQPVADGVISFQPQIETAGPSMGGRIVDGEYELQGVLPGVYRVEVRSWVTNDKTVNGPFGPTKERTNVIPKRYWGETTQLRAEVRPGSNAIHFEMTK
jgi:hypothetical protein